MALINWRVTPGFTWKPAGDRDGRRHPDLPRAQPLDETSDAVLVRLAREGATAAWEELICRYQDRVYTIAYGYLHDAEDALDVTQETFLRVVEGLPRFREQANFYTWLYRIVVNLCIDRQRKAGRRPPAISLDEIPGETGVGPVETRTALCPQRALETRELRDQIDAAIAALPEPYRLVVILADIEGLSHGEIAGILRCPVNTTKTRLHRGRLLIRERMKDYLAGDECEPS
jgi:RNA polymerase sigma-70 factor (ECF subfamily)